MRDLQRAQPVTRALSIAFIVLGIGLIAFSLAADTLGVGGGQGFGYQQMIVLIVGLVLLLSGGAILMQPVVNSKLRD